MFINNPGHMTNMFIGINSRSQVSMYKTIGPFVCLYESVYTSFTEIRSLHWLMIFRRSCKILVRLFFSILSIFHKLDNIANGL